MFISRLISSIPIIIFVWLTIFTFPNWFFAFVATSIVAIALFEFYSMIEKKGIWPYKYFGILIAIVISLSIYLEFQLTKGWELFFITITCLVVFIMQLAHRGNDQAILSVSTTVFGILYISWLFSFIIKLKLLVGGTGLVLFLILVTKCSDIGAYAFGFLFGRH